MSTSPGRSSRAFGGAQAAGVDRPEQHRHDQVPERGLGTAAAAVRLGEQGRQFLVGVDVGDVAGGPGQHACGQDVCPGAAAAEPPGEFPDRRGQALQGCRLDSPLPGRGDPCLGRGPGDRAQPGELGAAERLEPGQHPLLGVVLVADGAFFGGECRNRAGQAHAAVHRDTCPSAGASGSRAHLASRPREDFR